MSKDISIIIPTYNRPQDLQRSLFSYFDQDDVLEIIIIDDCSESSYKDVINFYNKKYPSTKLIYIKNEKNLGAGASRNIGIENAHGKYILWGEDDAFLEKNYAKILKNKISEKTIYFGSIYYGITPEMPLIEKQNIIKSQQEINKPLFNYNTLEGYYRKKIDGDIEVPFGHALLMAPISAYENIRYYEGYKINGYREETDAQVRMTKNGYKIFYTSDTECYHFPALNKEGGQHHSSRIKYEFYKIVNNNIFIDRHYIWLMSKYDLPHSKTIAKLTFDLNVITSLFIRMVKKIIKIS